MVITFKNPWDAEDLVQEVFVKALKSDWQQVDDTKVRSYLLSIAHNLAIDKYRSLKRFKSYLNSFVYQDSTKIPDSAFLLHKQIMKLPSSQREIFILRHIQDLSTEETAEILKVSVGTVKSQLNRAVQTIKNTLNNFDNQNKL